MSNVHLQCQDKQKELESRIAELEAAIRKHRDALPLEIETPEDSALWALLQEQGE